MNFGIAALQTLAFISIVFGNQASIYAIRSRRRLWSFPRPSRWLIFSSVADLLICSILAACGILMAPLPVLVVIGTLAGAVAYAFLADAVKFPLFHRLKMAD